MNEKKTAKWGGWVMATAALVVAGVLAISGAPQAESRASEASKTSVSSALDSPGSIARADMDTLDLQLEAVASRFTRIESSE